MHAKRITFFLLAGSMLATAATAQAQTEPADAVANADEHEIIVTANKRSENLQRVPQSLNVVGQAQLAQFHATQLTDIGAYVPGLQIDSQGAPGKAQISIRGLSPIGDNPTAAIYIDETPIGATSYHNRGSNDALDILPYDIQRIEVLKGPQGTLYGANALGGLIKYVTTMPSLDRTEINAGADLTDVSHGSGLGYGFRARIDTPIVAGNLGLIASYANVKSSGYIDNARTGQEDQNWARQESARAAVLWKVSDDLKVRLGYIYSKTHSDGDASVALDATDSLIYGDLIDDNYTPNSNGKVLHYFTGQLDWDLGWANFVSATSYSDQKSKFVYDQTHVYQSITGLFDEPDDLIAFPLALGLKRFTQELRLSSKQGVTLEWQAGAYYNHEKGTNRQDLIVTNPDGSANTTLMPFFVAELPTTYKEFAFFGNVDFHVTEQFDIGGGIRYSKNDQTYQQFLDGNLVPLLGLPVGFSPVGTSSEGVWTYAISPKFQITPDVMIYARISSGYQPGGPNVALPGVPPFVNSSTITSYEVGLKSQFFDRRATLNIALFDLEWKKIQVTATSSGGVGYTLNGGAARSQGIEADGSIRITDGLTVNANFAYTDATITEDIASLNAVSGDSLPFVPKWSGSIRAEYSQTISGDWTGRFGGGLRLVGDRKSPGVNQLADLETPGYTALDLNAGISNGRYTLSVFAKNLTDKRAYLSKYSVNDGLTGAFYEYKAVPIQPRTIGVSIDVKF